MRKPYYTLKPQTTPLPSTIAGRGVSLCGEQAQTEKGAEAEVSPHAAGGDAVHSANDHVRRSPDQPENDPFIRAEAEDDDGYDPYSDRPPAPEPTFQEDPWR